MALMKHEVERINDIVSVVVDCLYKDGKGKKLLQSLLNTGADCFLADQLQRRHKTLLALVIQHVRDTSKFLTALK